MSTVEGYHEYGGYLEYCGGIMMHVGDIMNTVGGVQYRVGKNLHYRHSNGPLGHRMERHTCTRPTT